MRGWEKFIFIHQKKQNNHENQRNYLVIKSYISSREESVFLTHEEFMLKRLEPVDIEVAYDALQRFIDSGYCRMRVPARLDDDDMILSRALDELKRYRKASEANA